MGGGVGTLLLKLGAVKADEQYEKGEGADEQSRHGANGELSVQAFIDPLHGMLRHLMRVGS